MPEIEKIFDYNTLDIAARESVRQKKAAFRLVKKYREDI